jgi:hypothetical protein
MTPPRRPIHASDIVVIGAPGAQWAAGHLTISAAARERADLAARYWLSSHDTEESMRVICIAGRPAVRSNMPALPLCESEAAEMIDLMLQLGVPETVIRPNRQHPLGREFSVSTVDEVAILMQLHLIEPEMYRPDKPLGIVAHERHGARTIDILRKVGFTKSQVVLLSPAALDSRFELVLRLIYRALVLRGMRRVSPDVLQRRERRLISARSRLKQMMRSRPSEAN